MSSRLEHTINILHSAICLVGEGTSKDLDHIVCYDQIDQARIMETTDIVVMSTCSTYMVA